MDDGDWLLSHVEPVVLATHRDTFGNCHDKAQDKDVPYAPCHRDWYQTLSFYDPCIRLGIHQETGNRQQQEDQGDATHGPIPGADARGAAFGGHSEPFSERLHERRYDRRRQPDGHEGVGDVGQNRMNLSAAEHGSEYHEIYHDRYLIEYDIFPRHVCNRHISSEHEYNWRKNGHDVHCREGQPIERVRQEQDSLGDRQAWTERTVLQEQGLNRATPPSGTLDDEGAKGFRGETPGKVLVEIARDETAPEESEGKQEVFRDRLRRKPASDPIKRGPSDDAVGAAAEGGVPPVTCGLDHVEEESLFIGNETRAVQIVLERIGIEERVGGLDDADLRIVEEAHASPKHVLLGNEVGVQDQNERSAGDRKGVVDVTRLGTLVIGPRQVADLVTLRPLTEPVAPTVVQHPDIEVRPVNRLGAQDGPFQHLERFIVSWDEDVHGGKGFGGK